MKKRKPKKKAKKGSKPVKKKWSIFIKFINLFMDVLGEKKYLNFCKSENTYITKITSAIVPLFF